MKEKTELDAYEWSMIVDALNSQIISFEKLIKGKGKEDLSVIGVHSQLLSLREKVQNINYKDFEEKTDKVFILALKESTESKNTHVVGVFKLNASTEFIKGVLHEQGHKVGEEVEYIYNADYSNNLEECLKWLKKQH